MKKLIREKVLEKFSGHCAYCGVELGSRFHVDHVKPVYRGVAQANLKNRGMDTIGNMFPACARCNIWKSTMDIEAFRGEISKQASRLELRSANFRLARDFGQIKETSNDVVFYFEKFREVVEGLE